jgi:DNA invertase Pin-like site-specific DNA recombinase
MGGRSGPELHTLRVQRATIERAAAARGGDRSDAGTQLNRSGADRSRPQFRAALERLTSREVDAMVVWKVSRFARDLTQARVDIDAILEAGADLVAGDEPFDTSSPQGRLMLNMLLSFAEYEREVLGEQFEVIKERVLERGSHLGRVPFGYLKARSTPRGDGDVDLDAARGILRQAGSSREPVPGGLVPHPEEAPLVRQLFEARAASSTIADLQRLVEQSGVRSDLVSATQIIAPSPCGPISVRSARATASTPTRTSHSCPRALCQRPARREGHRPAAPPNRLR